MLTTRDTLADAVDICAKFGRVLQTVHLSGLLVAPAMLEAAAVAGRVGRRVWVRTRAGDTPDIQCLQMVPGSNLFQSLVHAHTHHI